MKTTRHKSECPGGAGQVAEQSSVNTANSTHGTFPVKQNTVLAAVLADLLEGQRITGMGAVFEESTTRLAHHIYALKGYGWPVQSADKVVGTNDGRVATISEYWLSPEVIEAAMAQGAREWVDGVRHARRLRRKKAAEAKRKAAQFEVAKKLAALINPAQFNLFSGGAV